MRLAPAEAAGVVAGAAAAGGVATASCAAGAELEIDRGSAASGATSPDAARAGAVAPAGAGAAAVEVLTGAEEGTDCGMTNAAKRPDEKRRWMNGHVSIIRVVVLRTRYRQQEQRYIATGVPSKPGFFTGGQLCKVQFTLQRWRSIFPC